MFMKKLTALLTALVMAVLIIPAGFAARAEVFGGLLFRELSDGTYEVLRDPDAAKPSGTVSIPETVGGRRVSRIADGAFAGCGELSGVNVPESVTSVGANAFSGTALLKSQTGDVRYAGRLAVWCDPEADKVTVKEGTLGLADRLFYLAEDLESVSLPSTLVELGTATFHGCKKLESVNIPEGVESIGGGAFAECSALTSLTLPRGLKSVGSYAFYNSGITSVSLPESVEFIGKGAFQNSALSSVDIGSGYINIGGLAFEGTPFYGGQSSLKYAGTVLIGCDRDVISAEIKIGTTAVADMAFSGCGKLQSVSVPSSVRTIGSDAFFACEKLSAVTVPEGVTSVGENAFRLCSELSAVTLPQSLRYIKKGAFYGCVKLKTVNGDLSGVEIGEENGSLPQTPPDPPAVFVCTERSSSSIALSWEASCPADMYEVDIYKNGSWQVASRSSNTTCVVDGLEADTVYDFKVYSYRGDVYSSSAVIRAYTSSVSGKPDPVTNVKAVPTANSVELSWDKSARADSYEIDVYLDGKWTYLAKTSERRYIVTDLSPKTEYEFKIFAFGGSEYSASVRITVTTLDASGKPDKVTNVSAVSGSASVTLSWDKSEKADSYEIDVYKNGKWSYVDKFTACSYTVTGLSSGTEYEFRIFAFSGNEYSPSARIKAATLGSSGKPSAVSGVSATVTDSSVTLSWNKNAGADSYEVDMYKNGKWTFVQKLADCTCTVSGLSAETAYEFKIFAFKGEEYSSSTKVTALTLKSDRPARVTGAEADPAPTSVTLSWNKSKDADSYEIDIYRNGRWEFLTNTTNNTYTAEGLSAGTEYKFKIFAFKGEKYSPSVLVSATTVSINAPPSSAFSDTRSVMRGIDVSGWQGEIDFKAVKESGIDFVIIKAGVSSQNASGTVESWEKNYQSAKKCGLLVGAYWYTYADSIEEAKTEAEDFAAALKGKTPDLPVYLDLEESGIFANGSSYVTNLVNTFCGVLEDEGLNAGVYCSTTWFTQYVNESARLKRPAWIADYRGKCLYEGAYGIWQYGTEKVPGIDQNCDANWAFNV